MFLKNEQENEVIKFNGKLFTNDIINFFNRKIRSMVHRIGNQTELYDFFKMKQIPKVMIFARKSQVPLMMRLLSNKYNHRLSFGYVSEAEKEIINRYDVKTLPFILGFNFNHEKDFYD